MENTHLPLSAPRRATPLPPRRAAAWWIIGAWTRLAIVGGLLTPAGLALLADPAERGLAAFAMIVGGPLLAYFAARRAVRAIDRVDGGEDAPAVTRRRFAPTGRLTTDTTNA